MKKLLAIFFVLSLGLVSFAGEQEDVQAMFNKYVNSANTYQPTLLDLYSPNAKIIRQIIKPDGSTVNATTDMKTYAHQMKLSQSVAKMKHYTNSYSNVSVSKVSNGYKVSAYRTPMKNNDKLYTYQIWQKQSDGSWVIIEELMQTREQILLKYADK